MRGRRFFILLLYSFYFFSTPCLKAQANPEKKYIIHVIKFGETLSKISREYGVSVSDILNVNPSLSEINNLSPDQLLRIPVKKDKKIITNSNTISNDLKPKVINKEELPAKNSILHTVEKGQTIYSISKMYNVGIEDLQKWNNLTDFHLKIGARLLVKTINKIQDKNKKEETNVKEEEAPPQVVEDEALNRSDQETPDIQASENASQKELGKLFKEKTATGNIQTEKGTGAPMTTSLGAMENTYFAMHKTLSIGTIIKIKNLVNSRIAFAKIIGKLPDTDENKHVIIRYTLGVKKDLQLQNGKCYLQIQYPE